MNIQNLSGQTFGQYELRDVLGFGGMGVAYRGYQKSLERLVAIKVLTTALANEPGYIERFYREAKTAAALEHAHIVPVYDYGVQGDISYVVMRLLTGGSLEQRAQQRVQMNKPLPSLGEVSNLLNQLASGLDYAHSKGVIHRDIKPGNVMFDDQGLAYIVDFGIAKLVESTTSFTASGVPMGTPIYMPPEQWKSEELTPAADQYALAVTIYALITGGHLPFDATTPYGMMHKHINEPPTPAQNFRADLPDGLTPVLERAMSKRPADRYPTVTAFAQDFAMATRGQTGELTNFFTAPILSKRTNVGSPSSPFSASNAPQPNTITIVQPVYKSPVMWILAAALLIALGVVGFMLLRQDDKNTAEPGLSAANVQLTLTAARESAQLSPDQVQTIQAQGYMQLTEMAGATQTDEAQVNLRLTQIGASTETQVAVIAAQQNATATAEQATQAAANQTATAEDRATQTQSALNAAATLDSYTDTPEPSSTPRPTSTPEATEAVIAPAVEPDIRLVYDTDDFVIANISGRTLDINGLSFVQNTLRFDATLWSRADISTPPDAMTRGTCYQILTADATPTTPSRDLCTRSFAFTTSVTSRYFWLAPEADATFTVERDGTTLATCEIAAGECSFALPEPEATEVPDA
ncbi:MAG TPA: serine/threonine-protein kinase [Aggregatilineaceae bacterium]|nr:serine/threonine-protein kinase [Aggregatilineaceae bacterium]